MGRIERRGRPRKTAVPLEAEAAKQILPAKDEDQEEGEDDNGAGDEGGAVLSPSNLGSAYAAIRLHEYLAYA